MIVYSYRIDLTEVPKPYADQELVKVLPRSPMQLRKQVERFAWYFKREGHFDFLQYEAADGREDIKTESTAYLFRIPENRFPLVWIGAASFRTREFKDVGRTRVLQWIWLHPYWRNHGMLTKLWPTLRAEQGDFFTKPPLSPAMEAFLRKHNQESKFAALYEAKDRDAHQRAVEKIKRAQAKAVKAQ